MATDAGAIVYNHDVSGIQRRINRFIVEMIKSVSNASSLMNEYDQTRLGSYLAAIRAYVAWVTAQPQLDLPETSPRPIVLDANPTWDMIENESLVDVVRMLEIARDEIVNSQSARNASGLVKYDQARLLAIVEKVENMLTSYISKMEPLDLPESSPMRIASTAGKTGV